MILAHLDLDAFFAAVEELEAPELREKPLVVGGDPHGRGVVATANYEGVVYEMDHNPWDIRALRDSLQYMLNRRQIVPVLLQMILQHGIGIIVARSRDFLDIGIDTL